MLVTVLVLCLCANLSLAQDNCTEKLPGGSSNYNVGVQCGGLTGKLCTGFRGISHPFNCGDTPEGCNIPEYPLPGYNGLWLYTYSYVDGLPEGYGSYPGGCFFKNATGVWNYLPKYTDEEFQTISDAVTATNLDMYVEISTLDGGSTLECSISAITSGGFETCNSCSPVGCEGLGQPCIDPGCGEGVLEGPRAIQYDCTNLQIGNRVGIAGCGSLNPVFYPFLEDTENPTSAPTANPSATPTDAPTNAPTNAPTDAPTNAPTDDPTSVPTDAPTSVPTGNPTRSPTPASTDPSSTKGEKKGKKGKKGKSDKKAKRGKKAKG